MAVMVNSRGWAACWGRAGMQEPGYHQGLQGNPSPSKEPHFSPCLLGRDCLVQQRREAERAGLPAGLCALAHPLSPCWQRAAERRATCPWSCMFTIQAAKLPWESLAAAHCHCSGQAPMDWVPQGLASSAGTPPHLQLCAVRLALPCSFGLGEGYVCKDSVRDASTGCTSGFLLSPWTHLVSVAQLSSPHCLCWCCIWLWWVSSPRASPCVWVLFGTPNTISDQHCPAGHRGCSLSSAPAGAQLPRGLSMQRVCTLASLFNSAIHRLSKILQREERQSGSDC